MDDAKITHFLNETNKIISILTVFYKYFKNTNYKKNSLLF